MPIKGMSSVDALSARVDIKDPATGRKVAWVELAGPEHPKRKTVLWNRQRRMRAVMQRTGKIELTDPADDEAEQIDLLVACTLAWSDDWVDDGGAPLAFTAENVRREYSREGWGHVRRQLAAALDEQDRFIRSSAAA